MGAVVHDWHSYLGARSLADHARRHPNGMRDRTGPADGVGKAVAVARVSGSCWIVDCPDPACGGAEFANFVEPLFFCCACRNAAWENRPLAVEVPSAKQRGEVEAVLVKRDDPNTRNWVPGESVSDLKVENVTRGVAP